MIWHEREVGNMIVIDFKFVQKPVPADVSDENQDIRIQDQVDFLPSRLSRVNIQHGSGQL